MGRVRHVEIIARVDPSVFEQEAEWRLWDKLLWLLNIQRQGRVIKPREHYTQLWMLGINPWPEL